MRVDLIAVGRKQPVWVNEGYRSYAQRLRAEVTLRLVEVPAAKRARGGDTSRMVQAEGLAMLRAIPRAAWVVALDERGAQWTTRALCARLRVWLAERQVVAMLLGGPDGLAGECLARADERWGLSALTLPHGLVRVMAAEQLYRAWSLLHNHPYHRD